MFITQTVELHHHKQVKENGNSGNARNGSISATATEDDIKEINEIQLGTNIYSESEHQIEESILCSVCLNSFHVGEKVSWARYNAECQHGK